jgi:hypothetical protein
MIRAISSFPLVFNNTVINSAGASELDALIDMIFTKSQVVQNIFAADYTAILSIMILIPQLSPTLYP